MWFLKYNQTAISKASNNLLLKEEIRNGKMIYVAVLCQDHM